MKETAEERRESYKVCCLYCKTLLTEGRNLSASMICPGCGRHLVIRLQNGRLTIFKDRRKKNFLLSVQKSGLANPKNSDLT